MPAAGSSSKPGRRRRADAERSIEAILDAAVQVLGGRPDASVDDVAAAAGVSRQTVYAHFASREALTSAVLDRVTDEVIAALDAAALDEGPATDALLRLLDTSWEVFERHPFLPGASAAAPDPAEDEARHRPIVDRLEQLVRRGQAAGEFDRDVSPTWLVAATVALGHAAGEEVSAGRMSHGAAAHAVRRSVLRVFGAASQ